MDFGRRRNEAAFTLVELVVAAAITVVLAGILIGITSSTLDVWNRTRNTVVSVNQVDFVFDELATDIEGALSRNDGNVWLAATILENNNGTVSLADGTLRDDRNWVISGAQTVSKKPRASEDGRSFVLNAGNIADCRFGLAGVWLRFFTAKQQSNNDIGSLSAPSAVAYQIVRRNVSGPAEATNAAEIRYMLFRSEVRVTLSDGGAPGTFQAGYDLDPVSGGYTTPDASHEGDVGNVISPHANQAIAYNVVDFGVRLFVREGGQLRLVFPARPARQNDPDPDAEPPLGEPSGSNPVPAAELSHLARPAASPDLSDFYRKHFPDVVEVMVRVLTEEGAQMIQNLEAGRIEGDWWDIAEAHSRVFTRRFEIQGRGL